MAPATGQTTDSLIRFLLESDDEGDERFHKFDFFRLVRLVEQTRPELPRVGHSRTPAQDILRFAQKPYQNFASSSFQALESFDAKPPRLSVAFFGLFGPCGALPLCFTEHALDRLRLGRPDAKPEAIAINVQRLKPSDFSDLQGWVRRLRRHEDPMTALLWEKFPVSARQRLQDLSPSSFQTPPLRDEFLRDMSAAMAATDLLPAAQAAALALPQELVDMAVERAARGDLYRLNRCLLGLAYSQEISVVRRFTASPWDFEPWHFNDLAGAVRQCRDGSDLFSKRFRELFPPRIRQLLADFPPGQFVVEPLLSDFLGGVNDVMATVDLIGAGACAELRLPAEIQQRATEKPTGAALAQLNRSLIVFAFGGKILSNQGEPMRDQAFTHFLDIFHHRMTSHFYRAWRVNQKSCDLDRPDNYKTDERQKFPFYLSSLLGAGLDSAPASDGITPFSRIYYSGLLSSNSRNAAGLQSILEDYFGVPTRVLPFAGRWLPLPAQNLTRVGASRATGLLGQSVIVGSQFWDCQLSFRIRMGPMGLADFTRLLPQREIVCSHCSHPLDPEHRLLDKLPEGISAALAKAGGCPHCHYHGPEDWDTELRVTGSRAIVCKKCRAPFGPDALQAELQKLPPAKISERLAQTQGCVPCRARWGKEWRITEVGSFHRLRSWIKTYLGDEYFWDLQLILRKEEAPITRLGATGRLGQTIWNRVAPPSEDLTDMIISPSENS